MPLLGDFAIRCRVAGVEVLAEPGVFVPTPDADHFVDMALERVDGLTKPTIVEVGTGCGAIALALAHARSDAEVHATDLFPAAVRSARNNARRLALDRVCFYRGSVLDPLPAGLGGRVDVIIANLPFYPERNYASIGSVPRETIQGAGEDGLDLLRQLARDAIRLLRPEGRLLLQMFARQWETLFLELTDLGYRPGSPRLSGPFAICPADLVGTRETERAERTDAVDDSAADFEMSGDAAD
jgi:release factor glutamine methyltransferase